MNKNLEYQKKFHQKQKAKGLVYAGEWIPAGMKEKFKQFARDLREEFLAGRE